MRRSQRASLGLASLKLALGLAGALFGLSLVLAIPSIRQVEAQTTSTVGPIVEIKIIQAEDSQSSPCPEGYVWPGNQNDLNTLAGGNYVYLCYKRGADADAITNVKVVNIDEDEDRPSSNPCGGGWSWINSDLNEDADGNYIFICYRKDGAYPIIDLRTITSIDFVLLDRCVTSDAWTRIDVDLNDNAGGDFVYLCYSDTKNLLEEFSCGNEGEEPCGFFTRFFWENGSGGCDRSLSESNGVCVDDGRRSDAVTALQDTWVHWALENQRRYLNWDSPLTSVMQFGGHNAFNNSADGYIFPSQAYSITDQLRIGARFIELDVHSGNTVLTGTLPELCHTADTGHGGCVRTDRLFYNAIKEIRNWLVAPGNEDEVVIISLADVLLEPGEVADEDAIAHVNFIIDTYLNDNAEIGVFSAADFAANGNVFPSQAELVAMDKRVIVFSTRADMNPLIMTTEQWPNDLNRLPGEIEDAFWDATTCSGSDQQDFDPDFKKFRTVYEDFATTGELFSVDEIKRLVECNVTILNLDAIFADASGLPPFTLSRGAIPPLNAMVWSWAEGDWGGNGDAALRLDSTGRWVSRDPSEEHAFLCYRAGGMDELPPFVGEWGGPYEWAVTPGAGPWIEGFETCARTYAGSTFSVPVNGFENSHVYGTGSDAWMNYSKLDQPGVWTQHVPPTLTLTGPTTANEGDAVRFTAVVSPLEFHDDIDIACPSNAIPVFEPISITQDATIITCYVPDGPATIDDATASVTDELGATVIATLTEDLVAANVDPTVSAGGNVSLNEGDSVSLAPAAVSDPGFDCAACDPASEESFSASVDWDDGSTDSGTLTVTPGDGEFNTTASVVWPAHTYVDNGDYTIEAEICDDDAGCSTDEVTASVSNVAPALSGFPATLTVDEGESFTQDFQFADPGVNDTFTSGIDYGDTTPNDGPTRIAPGATSVTVQHTYANDGSYSLTVTICDNDGGCQTVAVAVTVENVAPSFELGANATINEGGTFSRDGSFSDPGADVWMATVDYGSGEQALTLNADKSFSLSHLYGDNGTPEVTVCIEDGDDETCDSLTMTVNNVAPSVADPTIDPGTSNEGAEVSAGATFSDPGTSDGPFTCVIDWGDETPTTAGTVTGLTCSGSHTYADDDPTGTSSDDYTVTFEVTDKDDGASSKSTSQAVDNVTPAIVSITTNSPVPQGQPATLNVATTDPGVDDLLTYDFDCDNDGTYEQAGNGNSGACTLDPAAATTTIGVRVSDDDLGVVTGSVQVKQTLTLCASFATGALSGITAAGVCPAASATLVLPGPAPVTLCINAYTGAIRWSPGGSCAGGKRAHLVPASGPLYYCESVFTGRLRGARAPFQCTTQERPGVIPG